MLRHRRDQRGLSILKHEDPEVCLRPTDGIDLSDVDEAGQASA